MLRIFWVVFAFGALCIQGHSQNQTENTSESLTIHATDMTLQQLLRHLHDRYQIDFAYDQSILENSFRPDIHIQNAKFDIGLEKIFNQYNLDADLKNPKKILLRKRSKSENESPKPSKKHINGLIVHAQTKEEIPFALISVPVAKVYATPDEKGRFTISYPTDLKKGVLLVQLLGFETFEIALSEITDKSFLSISLVEDPVLVDEIVILGSLHIEKLASASPANSRLLSQDQLLRSSAFLMEKDVLRSLQFLPGVAAHNDQGGSIQIRGSSSDEAIVLLDKIPLYSSSHYYGIFSSINPNYTESIELYKNNYPIQFGGKTGGMVNINGISKVPKRVNGNLSASLLHGAANLNFPLSSTGIITLSGRSTYRNISNSNFYNIGKNTSAETSPAVQNISGDPNRNEIISTNPNFGFRDFHAKWNQRIKDHDFEVGFFYSKDNFSNSYDVSLSRINHHNNTMSRISFNNVEEWSNLGASLFWKWNLSSNSSLNTTAYFTKNNKLYDLSSTLTQGAGNIPAPNEINSFQENKIKDVSLDIHLDKKIKTHHRLIVGSKIIHHNIDFIADRDTERLLGNNNSGNHLSGYAQWISEWSDKLTTKIGVRANHFAEIDRNNISPVLELVYSPSSNISFKTSYSNYDQYQRSFSFENSFGQTIEYWAISNDRNIPVMNCTNYMVGAIFNKEAFYLDIEVYYRDFSGVLEFASSQNGFNTDMSAPPQSHIRSYKGRGNSKGIDLGLGFENNILNILLSYTLSKSVNRFPEILMGQNFPSQYDRRHQLKSSNTFKLNKWNIGINYVFASGKPYTDLSLLDGEIDRNQTSRDQRINYLPDYHRLDIGFDYKLPINHNVLSFGLSVVNILDRKNVKYIQNIYSIQNEGGGGNGGQNSNVVLGTETSLLGRTLNMNINYSF